MVEKPTAPSNSPEARRAYNKAYYERNRDKILKQQSEAGKKRREQRHNKEEEVVKGRTIPTIPSTPAEIAEAEARAEARREYKRNWWREHYGKGQHKNHREPEPAPNEGRTDPRQHLVYDPHRLEWVAAPPQEHAAAHLVTPVQEPPANGGHATAQETPTKEGSTMISTQTALTTTDTVANSDSDQPQVVYRLVDEGIWLITVRIPDGSAWTMEGMADTWKWSNGKPYYLADRTELPMYVANAVESILKSQMQA